MKKWTVKLAAMLMSLPVIFGACVKDNCKQYHTYTFYEPVYSTKAEVKENIKSGAFRKIENPGKIYILGDYIFLNEVDRGIHVIDNSNPSRPLNISFINIPGNQDLAVKGNMLYADMYSDLVVIDISNPHSAKATKFVDNVFPNRGFYGINTGNPNDKIIVDWRKKDTTITGGCDRPVYDWLRGGGGMWFMASASSPYVSTSPIGVGGSMARFTIMNNRLYTVTTSKLNVFNITTPDNPVPGTSITLGWNIETIYPFENKLFIGSQNGMFIYDVSNPDAPAAAGQFTHARSCDPVIADNEYAYVTLRSGTTCQGFTNQMDVVKLNNLSAPVLKKSYQLTNPHGLSKDGNLMFICDGKDGLRIYNAADVMDLKQIKHIKEFDAYDVIAFNNIALVIGKDGLYQYSYANPANIRLLSKITVDK